MKKLLFILLVSISSLVQSQPWNRLLLNKVSGNQEVKFYDLQRVFYQYWEGKDVCDKHVTKGKGYKQFKRWEAYMIPRVYPSGYFPAGKSWSEFLKERKRNILKSGPISNWLYVGPQIVPKNLSGKPSGIGRINCLAFHPSNPDIIFAGSPSGGFWKTTDGGANWITTTDQLPSIGISDIAINPSNPDIIYIATGDGDASDTYSIGVLKSTDGGLSWNTTGLTWTTNNKLVIRRLLINPSDPNILIAGTTGGIYYSINSGVSWSNVQTGHFKDLEFNPSNPNIVYAARYGSGSSRFYRSVDGGASFTEIPIGVNLSEVYRLELAVSPANPDIVYALYSDNFQDGFHSLWKSTNTGSTWTKVYDASGLNLLGWEKDGSDLGGQGWYDLTMAVSPVDATVVYVGGINIWKSANSGVNWSLTAHWEGDGAPYVHADHHTLLYSPFGVLFDGNDGGVYKTTDAGLNWTDISNGMQILQIDRIGTSQLNNNVVMLGNQDNGSMKYNAMDNSWVQILGGDGADCFIDYKDLNVVYSSAVKGDLRRSLDGGSSFTSIKPAGAAEGAWHTPFVINPIDNQILYAGYEDVWCSTNRGTSWQKISNKLSVGKPLTQITVAPTNSNYIYTTNGTQLWITKNGGITWGEIISGELSGLYITYLAVADDNPEKAWLTVSGFVEGKKVFQTENAGASWLNISVGLPNVPVNCIVHENLSNDVLYVGTDIGVYYKDVTQISWQIFNTGLPKVEISELEIQYTNSKLISATRGRGLWQSSIALSAPNAPRLLKAVTSIDGTKVDLIFSKDMADPTGKENEFTISNGVDIHPIAISYKEGYTNTYSLTLPIVVMESDILKISYTRGSVASYDNELLESFVYSGIRNTVGVDIINIDESANIKVFPNPNSGYFEIRFTRFLDRNIRLKLVQLNGQVVYNEALMINSTNYSYQVKTPELGKGAYLLIIETNHSKYQKIIVIE